MSALDKWEADKADMMPRDLLEALLPHACSLESSYVNFNDYAYQSSWSGKTERLYMGYELREMQALTGMSDTRPEDSDLPFEIEGAPTLVDCLPENLEKLEIHC